jgi:hypothetical protein
MALEGLKSDDLIKEVIDIINKYPPMDRPPAVKAIILGVEKKLVEEIKEFQELANSRIEAMGHIPKVQ